MNCFHIIIYLIRYFFGGFVKANKKDEEICKKNPNDPKCQK